ncbi:collagen alpha-6(VI) chain-like [Microcaecilia unicolor]|uniref:Collagen alpha-6(VI) chain-like n=1 Tax=Microcaecilia unicolor TaxID=1415580 RepID=A0A6P7ZVF8_9AMPH|nr:collagen alpha-6(VI) chain-like [Microcaecilia unicolor]
MKAIGILFTVLSLWIGLCPVTDSTNSTNSTTQCTTKQEAILVYLQDGSGSIWPQDFNKSKAFAVNITQHFQIGRNNVQVGYVQFSDNVQIVFTPDTYDDANSITSAIMNMVQLKQGTKTGKALDTVIRELRKAAALRPGVPIYLIVVTDGESQDSVLQPAENLRNTTNAMVYCIGVGTEANQTELNQIAGNKSRVFTVGSFDGLKDIENTVMKQMCSEVPVQKDSPPAVSNKECTTKQEAILVYLQDGSGSIWPQDFNKSKAFAVNITQHFQIGRNNVQVGYVQFSDNVQIVFTPDTYDDANSITSAIMNMVQLKQGTKTGKALDTVIRELRKAAALRPGVPIYLIVVTDGESQDSVLQPAENLRNTTNAMVYCIGVGTEANQTELHQIAGNKSRVFTIGSFDGLKDIENTVMKQMCSEVPVQKDSPPAVSNKECTTKQEAILVYLQDGSGSIWPQDFNKSKAFAVNITQHFQIGRNNVQVGYVQSQIMYKLYLPLTHMMMLIPSPLPL